MRGARPFVTGCLMLIACGGGCHHVGRNGDEQRRRRERQHEHRDEHDHDERDDDDDDEHEHRDDPGVCVVGQDQTCNDELSASVIWGKGLADGSCLCNPGFEINPATGHCRLPVDGGAGMRRRHELQGERVLRRARARSGRGPGALDVAVLEPYFMCMEHTCACAIMNFVSASCVSPTCVSEEPVQLRCVLIAIRN